MPCAWLVALTGITEWSLIHVGLDGSTESFPLPLEGIAGLHLRKACADGGNPACREVWYFDGSIVAKASAAAPGVLLDQYRLPGTVSSGIGQGGLTARP